MSDYTLFDFAESIARNSDPETSHLAAAAVAPSLSGYRAVFVERLRLLGEATANEVAQGDETIRKRARECARLGFVVECGTRKCRNSGHKATVWKVKE